MSIHDKTSQIMEILKGVGLEIATGTIEDIPVSVARGLTSTEYDPTMKALVTIMAPFSAKRFSVYFYVAVGEVDTLSKQTLEQFTASAYRYCQEAIKFDKKQKKLKFKGVTCIPILLSTNADNEAKGWANRTTKAHYQAIEIPVVIDSNTDDIYYNNQAPIKMRVFYMPGREMIETLIRKSLASFVDE